MELTFGVSGRLWRENLIMYDRQTDSWWAQASGQAIRGKMKGTALEIYPSSMMTWKQWRDLQPNTLVLSKLLGSSLEGMRDHYREYHRSSQIGVTGRTRVKKDNVGPKTRVVGFRLDGQAFAVPLNDLQVSPILATTAAGQGVVVVGAPDRTTAKVFLSSKRTWGDYRAQGGRTIFKDKETETEWDGFAGRAISGPQAGTRLEEIPSSVSYWFAWKSFFPDTTILKPMN